MSRNDTDTPLRGVAIYNPRLLSREELAATFVARVPLLERLVEDVRIATDNPTPQHRLLIGQRGMGKTMLLHRLALALEERPELDARWIALTFPEEQYNVATLADVWLNCLDSLGDALEQRGDHAGAKRLDERVHTLLELPDSEQRATQAFACLKSAAESAGRKLLLLFDNFDLILERLPSDHWTLRELLSAEPWLMVVGASSRITAAIYKYKAAFYDFFAIDELRGLNDDEIRSVLRTLSTRAGNPEVKRYLQAHPARLSSLRLLTGGNPRTITMLYEILAEGAAGDLRSDLDRLLDRYTPLYKARFEALPTQAQHVVDGLAIHWDPIGAGELAARVRIGNRAVSTQLDRLTRAGVVEKVPLIEHGTTQRRKKSGYQLAERFFNIWYLMRASRRVRQKLVWLVKFLQLVNTPDDLRTRALGHRTEHDAARRAVELDPDDPHSSHTLACVLAAMNRWDEAAPVAAHFLRAGTEQFFEQCWTDVVRFFHHAVAHGHAREAIDLLDQTSMKERWRPLREALIAVAAGGVAALGAVAPEVREPAERLYRQLTDPALLERA